MQRSAIVPLRTPLTLAAILCLFAATLSAFSLPKNASAASASTPYVALDKSFIKAPTSAAFQGQHASNAPLTISVVLQPNNSKALDSLLNAIYTPGSRQYHHWLATGEFNKLFGPTTAQHARVISYLQQSGLAVTSSPSPFIVRAVGSTARVETAFHTTINNYRAANGKTFFQNDSSVQVPATLSDVVSEVMGLTNTVRVHSNAQRAASVAQAANTTTTKPQAKTTPKYGAGPNGSGLVPAQIAGIYDASSVYSLGDRGKGRGANLAVFELSGYTHTDPVVYERQYFGLSEHMNITDINVDGGPVTPICPAGDLCGPFDGGACANGCSSADYSGDVEVAADIEMQIAIAPKASHIYVYNAPNDAFGMTEVDEYMKIANDNIADSISSSWGLCELDGGFAYAKAESIAFEQMALQGQSMFSSSGDTGAYDCIRDTGSPNQFTPAVDDPTSQPFVTSVGGTSFEAYDPGSNLKATYHPETVWNVSNRCNSTSAGRINNCATNGTGGGGVSAFWPKPSYQTGPGVISDYSQTAPYCSEATGKQYCREVPDVSANADQTTPYSEYCTGSLTTNSQCTQPFYGWFGIGGTSLSSPLWSGVIALWDSVHGKRFGNANYGLYQIFHKSGTYSKYFHDITGIDQTENTNGLYPTTPKYDMATGIGSPRISAIAKYNF